MWGRQYNSRFVGFRYKLDADGRHLVAAQMLFTHGYASPIFKKNENGLTEDDMKEIRLQPWQRIGIFRKRKVQGNNVLISFLTTDNQVFFEYLINWPFKIYSDCDIPVSHVDPSHLEMFVHEEGKRKKHFFMDITCTDRRRAKGKLNGAI